MKDFQQNPFVHDPHVGFGLAAIPEPSTLALAALAAGCPACTLRMQAVARLMRWLRISPAERIAVPCLRRIAPVILLVFAFSPRRADARAGAGDPELGCDGRRRSDAAAAVDARHGRATRRVARSIIAVDSARKRGDTLGHILFDGPPGLGKTTFATCIPRDLGVGFQIASGAGLHAQGSDPVSDQRRGESCGPVHRRDSPAAEGGRGISLSGDGGLSHRPAAGRRGERPHDQHGAAAVYADRAPRRPDCCCAPSRATGFKCASTWISTASTSWPRS